MMTGLDLIVLMFFKACVISSIIVHGSVQSIMYECPLIATHAQFLVWQRVCPIPEDRPTFLIENVQSRRGFVLTPFGDIGPAFVDAQMQDVRLPPCR